MEKLQSKYELIGNSIDEVLDAVNALKFHYGKDCVIVEDESGHDSGENPNKTEVIENEIITLLNKAEIDLNRSEFESLAESIIDYIDEIARRKK